MALSWLISFSDVGMLSSMTLFESAFPLEVVKATETGDMILIDEAFVAFAAGAAVCR